MLPLIIAQYEFLIQLCHCHVIRIIHNTGRSVCGRLQQSFQNKPAYFNYHPVGLIIAVILDVPVDVMSVQSIYAIEEDGLSGEHLVELEEMDKPYFEKIVRGVHANKESLEKSLRLHLKDGSAYDHMNATMQALLLCAMYELAYTTDVDAKIIIQEYVDLAYAFFMKNEPKMINALLDQIAKDVRI